MIVKYNINRIDNLLKDNFENVQILEKSSKEHGYFFEITIKDDKEVKLILPYKNIDGNNRTFEILYYENPLNESSNLICRNSDLNSIHLTIKDIIDNNRFSEEYLNIKN
jgi:hypothetical protein